MCRMAFIMIGVALSWGLYACATISVPDQLKLGMSDAGKAFTLARGGALEITLQCNPTTGYSWTLLFSNDAVLKATPDYTFKSDAALPGVVGVGGQCTFRFQGVGEGTAHLRFGYQRPWEKDTPPIETYDVTVTVR